MEQIIFGTMCFVIGTVVGVTSGIVIISLCAAAKKGDHQIGIDICDGCYGAANGDCQNCPRK